MPGLEDLYREIILDHYRNPRNRGELETPPATRTEGFNPLCGDEIVVYLDVDDAGTVTDIRIGGQGCSISQSSASMMSAAVKGKTIDEVHDLTRAFKAMMSIHENSLESGNGRPTTPPALAGANHPTRSATPSTPPSPTPALTERLRSGTLSETLDAPAGFGFGFDTETASAPRPKAPPSSSRAKAKAQPSVADPTEKAAAGTAHHGRPPRTGAVRGGDDRGHEPLHARCPPSRSSARPRTRSPPPGKRSGHGKEPESAAEDLASHQQEQERLEALLDDARRRLEVLETGPG